MNSVFPEQSTVYYNGSAFFTEVRNGHLHARNTKGLKRGESHNRGKWGARARRVFVSRVMYMHDHSQGMKAFTMCLTYRHNPTKVWAQRNLNAFLQWMRRRGMQEYAWTLELTQRGVIHYHLIVLAPFIPKDEIKEAWGRIRRDPAPNCVNDIRVLGNAKRAAAYASKISKKDASCMKAAKYASKLSKKNTKDLEHFRLHATSSGLVGTEKITSTEYNLLLAQILHRTEIKTKTTESGVQVFSTWLNRYQTREIFDLISEMREKQREEQEKIARAREYDKRISELRKRQMSFV